MPRIADMSRYLIVRNEWFAYNPMRVNVGSLGWAHSDSLIGVISPDYVVFSCTPNIEPRLLYWYLTSETGLQAINFETAGSVRERLYFSSLAKVRMPLPPVDEQRRMIGRIEAMLTKVDSLTTLESEAARQTGVLVSAEEMRVWPESSVVGAPTLAEVTEFLSRGRQSEQGPSDHFLIKTQHVQNRRYVRSNMTLAGHVAAKVGSDALARIGDVLIACSAAGCLGRVAPFHEDQKASTDTHVAIARANRDIVLPEYLYAYLRGAQGQFQLKSREQGDWRREKVSFRLTELNLADLRRVPVPLPGLQEQRRIVDYIERFTCKIATLRGHQAKRSEEVAALRPSILNSAFSGQL